MPAPMLFNSINYFLFLSGLFFLNYILPGPFRWVLILIASVIFYLISGIQTIFVPIIIIVLTYVCGILIERTPSPVKRNFIFITGLLGNLGLLIFYKYVNFIVSTAVEGYRNINALFGGTHLTEPTIALQIIVPLGISYITFQAVGYLIEINRGNQKPELNPAYFASYMLFFPKLLSGPIERAHNFLPQLRENKDFNSTQIVEGLKRILWGLFLKLVVANRLAIYTDAVFNNFEQHSGITLLIASVFFTFQLFADFAAYTDIAIGSAMILGYRLMENFNRPFMAVSVTEFWRRWHISLTTWVSDYIYNPIVIRFRNWNKFAVVFASISTFLILGFWHGANWTFILFGLLNGIALSAEFLSRRIRKQAKSKLPKTISSAIGITFTFSFFCFSCIFFKSDNVTDAFTIISGILHFEGDFYIGTISFFIYGLMGIIILFLKDITDELRPSQFLFFKSKAKSIRLISYCSTVILILLFGVFDGGQFIYFQF